MGIFDDEAASHHRRHAYSALGRGIIRSILGSYVREGKEGGGGLKRAC